MSSPLLAVAFAVLGAGPNFSDAWYREVVEGDLSKAYDEYRQILEGPTAVSTAGRGVGVRRMAAYRAGLCAEKLGRSQAARDAYEWFHDYGSPGDIWTQRALARLEVLKRRSGLPSRSLVGSETAVLSEIAPLPAKQRESYATNAKGMLYSHREAAQKLEDAVNRQREEEERRRRIQIALREMGVEVYWPRSVDESFLADEDTGDEDSGHEDSDEDVQSRSRARFGAMIKLTRELSLDRETQSLLERRVARRIHVEGLKALRSHDLYRARAAFRLYNDYRDADPESDEKDVVYSENLELLRSVENILDTSQGLARIASRRLAVADRKQDTDIRGRARVGLTFAQRRLESGDRREALRLLQTVLTEGASAPPGLRSDGKLREIVFQAREYVRFLLLDTIGNELEAEIRKQTRDLFQFADELVIATLSGTRHVLSDVGRVAPRLEDPERMRPRLRREVEKRLELAEASRSDSSPGALTAADLLALLDWFPEIDEDDGIRRRIRRLPGQK